MRKLTELIPPQVRITRSIAYEVVYVDEFLKDKNQLGECRYDTKQILLRNGQSQTETFKTFLHETLHAVSFENKNLNLTERQVLILEDGLFRVMKLNSLI